MAVLHIGILTHNALHHTRRCIATLQAHTSGDWRAFIVDNASTDETPAFLAALDDPRFDVELRTDNLGVSGGRNRLFERMLPAMDDDDLLAFLDNDIEVQAGWDLPFRDAFATQPRLGVAGRWAFTMQVHASWRDILPEHTANSGPVDTVQGCCFFVRGAAARTLGGFDMALGGFWHEDDDYCIRALGAGWDVQRVRCPAIVHHEHGSGVALRPDRVAGSLANQAYLVKKWREQGAIDAHGEPVRPMLEPLRAVREQLAALLQRGAPLLRTEVNNALDDVTRLLHQTVPDEWMGVMATPVVRLILRDTVTQDAGDTGERARAALSRIASLRAARREWSGRPTPLTTGPLAFNALCTPRAWDDARWRDLYVSHYHDGSGRDYYTRSEVTWRDGQLLHGLRATGGLLPTARVLVVGHPSERCLVALSHAVASITVVDREPLTIEQVAGYATRPLGRATITVQHTRNGLPETPHDRRRAFDVIVCPNLSRYAPAAGLSAFLSALATWARPQAHLAAGVSVRVCGPQDGRWTETTMLADETSLRACGWKRSGPFELGVADETLLAAVPPDRATPSWQPRLARLAGPHLVTLASLLARRLPAAAA
jgi:GT2 family glycosyltransferase